MDALFSLTLTKMLDVLRILELIDVNNHRAR